MTMKHHEWSTGNVSFHKSGTECVVNVPLLSVQFITTVITRLTLVPNNEDIINSITCQSKSHSTRGQDGS